MSARQWNSFGSEHRVLTSLPMLNLERTVKFTLGFSLSVPHAAGIYFIHDIRGVLYIGQTKHLRRRFDEHLRKERNPLLIKACATPVGMLQFSWFQAPLHALNREERQLIKALRPFCNRIQYNF